MIIYEKFDSMRTVDSCKQIKAKMVENKSFVTT